MKKKISRYISILIISFLVITATMPAITAAKTPQSSHSKKIADVQSVALPDVESVEDLGMPTPAKIQQQEWKYWRLIFKEIVNNPDRYDKYLRLSDGYTMRRAVQIAAMRLHYQSIGLPRARNNRNDRWAIEWQRHYGQFFSRISNGNFNNKELSIHLKYERRRYHRKGW